MTLKVKCIDGYAASGNNLIDGGIYTVRDESENFYFLEEESHSFGWMKSRFIPHDERTKDNAENCEVTYGYTQLARTIDEGVAEGLKTALIKKYGTKSAQCDKFTVTKEDDYSVINMRMIRGEEHERVRDKAKAFACGYLAAFP